MQRSFVVRHTSGGLLRMTNSRAFNKLRGNRENFVQAERSQAKMGEGGRMKRNHLGLLLIVVALAVGLARGDDGRIYDEQADARKEIASAIAQAAKPGQPSKNIVLVFGANWCKDCHALDFNMHQPELAPLIEKQFVV